MEAPFDITDIPRFAFVPSTLSWIALGAAAAVLAVLLLFTRRTRKQRRLELNRASKDLHKLLKTAPEGELLARGSLLARRALSAELQTDITVLSPTELETFAETLTSPALRQAVVALASIESIRFTPNAIAPRPMIEALAQSVAACASEKSEAKR